MQENNIFVNTYQTLFWHLRICTLHLPSVGADVGDSVHYTHSSHHPLNVPIHPLPQRLHHHPPIRPQTNPTTLHGVISDATATVVVGKKRQYPCSGQVSVWGRVAHWEWVFCMSLIFHDFKDLLKVDFLELNKIFVFTNCK